MIRSGCNGPSKYKYWKLFRATLNPLKKIPHFNHLPSNVTTTRLQRVYLHRINYQHYGLTKKRYTSRPSPLVFFARANIAALIAGRSQVAVSKSESPEGPAFPHFFLIERRQNSEKAEFNWPFQMLFNVTVKYAKCFLIAQWLSLH